MRMETCLISTFFLWNLRWNFIDYIYNVFIERDAKCAAWTTLSGVSAWQLSADPNLLNSKRNFRRNRKLQKSRQKYKKAQTATHYVAVGLDNASSILCFALFFQRHPNSKMAKRTSFDNPRGNCSFTGSKKVFCCKNCFMKKIKRYIPLLPEMRKGKIKTFFSIIMKHVKCGTWSWNVLPKMRLDQRECFFHNPPWEKNKKQKIINA